MKAFVVEVAFEIFHSNWSHFNENEEKSLKFKFVKFQNPKSIFSKTIEKIIQEKFDKVRL